MTMSKRAQTALEKSIEHWLRIAACKDLTAVISEGFTATACPLCALYLKCSKCSDACPVKHKTRKDLCYNTPYYAALRALSDYTYPVPARRVNEFPKKEVNAEIRFLRGLLPR